jgi:hypothetical protein
MGNGDLKIELIKKICKHHPGQEPGRKRDWSYYVGGMGDHGDWYILKMMDVTVEELQTCLDELEEIENRPPHVYTEQELKDINTPTIHGNIHSNVYEDKLWAEIIQKKETQLIWGTQQNTKQA